MGACVNKKKSTDNTERKIQYYLEKDEQIFCANSQIEIDVGEDDDTQDTKFNDRIK